jgi:hypothetical protein
MISEERKAELNRLWGEETNDPDTLDWRNDLNEEETALIQEWDSFFLKGYTALCNDILELERSARNGNQI